MKTEKVIITKHASKRFKQRRGLPKKTMLREVFYALTKGRSTNVLIGREKHFVKKIIESRIESANIKLFNGFVWIFNKNILITLYPILGSKIIN